MVKNQMGNSLAKLGLGEFICRGLVIKQYRYWLVINKDHQYNKRTFKYRKETRIDRKYLSETDSKK